MKSKRRIFSFLLLSVYVFLLLHDFIPHSHSHHTVHQDHYHEHTHDHSHGDPEAAGDLLIKGHSHSSHDFHIHKFVYRASLEEDLIPFNPIITVACNDLVVFSELIANLYPATGFFNLIFISKVAFPNIGLRAPPIIC